MATNPDSTTSGIPVQVTWTTQGSNCFPPVLIEALQNANWRINLPDSLTTSSTSFTASTLADNIFRIDSVGAGYVPGNTIYQLSEQIINLDDALAPGTAVQMAFDAPGVADLDTAFKDIDYFIEPPSSGVYHSPEVVANGQITVNFFRIDDGTSAPYPPVMIRGRGKLLIPPTPSPP